MHIDPHSKRTDNQSVKLFKWWLEPTTKSRKTKTLREREILVNVKRKKNSESV